MDNRQPYFNGFTGPLAEKNKWERSLSTTGKASKRYDYYDLKKSYKYLRINSASSSAT